MTTDKRTLGQLAAKNPADITRVSAETPGTSPRTKNAVSGNVNPGSQSADETRAAIGRQREAELAKRKTQVSDNVTPKGGK
jgi:hypothetical protein